MENKLISVVLPVYNGEEFLADSIKSVLNQSHKNLELIIVNDCSTDNSLKIAQEFANSDNRIKIISNETNQKLPASLNIGFKNAKGEYLTWTSDDNMYRPQALKTMLDFLEKNEDCVMVQSSYMAIDLCNNKDYQVNTPQPPIRPETLIFENIVGPCFLYRKSAYEIIGDYDVNIFLAEDYDYWFRMCLIGKIGTLKECLYDYRFHQKSLTSTQREGVLKVDRFLKQKYDDIYSKQIPNFKQLKLEVLAKRIEQTRSHHGLYDINQIYSYKNELFVLYARAYKRTHNPIYLKAINGLGIIYKLKSKLLAMYKEIDFYDFTKNNLEIYNKAIGWIDNNTINNQGIALASKDQRIYPEVSGYYIPTLLRWGFKEKAISYADYLISIQNEDGSWNEPSHTFKYTFDTGQILKGLYALKDVDKKYYDALIRGCDYIVSKQRENGSIATDNYDFWALPNNKFVPESIHLYCLEPLQKLAKELNIQKYKDCVDRALKFYLADEKLTDFNTLSHFNAYIIEALIDLGEIKRAKQAMDNIATYQKENGSISAYSDVEFVCSTGLFQYAICWFKLGELQRANKAFNFAKRLQNLSGGWFGSYGKEANYFQDSEISWAVKYFLDALYFKMNTYNDDDSDFPDTINPQDGRYKLVESFAKDADSILDAGCGKGRYSKNLIEQYPDKNYCGFDISNNVIKQMKLPMNAKQGSFLNIPFDNERFDFVFCVETLEHCIELKNSIKELVRVIKQGGVLLIIDKDIKKLGVLEIGEWEQWFDENKTVKIMQECGLEVKVLRNIPYDNNECGKDLFLGFIGRKK